MAMCMNMCVVHWHVNKKWKWIWRRVRAARLPASLLNIDGVAIKIVRQIKNLGTLRKTCVELSDNRSNINKLFAKDFTTAFVKSSMFDASFWTLFFVISKLSCPVLFQCTHVTLANSEEISQEAVGVKIFALGCWLQFPTRVLNLTFMRAQASDP